MKLKELREKKAELVGQMSAILDKAEGESRAMTDDEVASFNDLKTQLDALNATIEAAETTLGEQRKLETPVVEPAGGADAAQEAEVRSFAGYIRGVMSGETRSDTNMTKGDNGAVIPSTIANKIVEQVRQLCPIVSMATTYRARGTLNIPYEDSASVITADYLEEEFTSPDGTAQKLLSVSLGGYLIRALTKVSRSLLNNSDIELVGYVTRKVAEAMAVKLEREYLVGTPGKISGIGQTVKKQLTSAAAGKITGDDLIDLQESVPDVYQGAAVWIMHPKTRAMLRKLKDAEGRYMLNPDMTAKWGYTLLGKPVYTSEAMPEPANDALAVYYGDMSGLASKVSEDVNIQLLREMYAEQHALGVLAFVECDAKIENAQKIAALKMKAGE